MKTKEIYFIEENNKFIDVYESVNVAQVTCNAFFKDARVIKGKDGETAFIHLNIESKGETFCKASIYDSAVGFNKRIDFIRTKTQEELFAELSKLSIENFIYKN